VETPNYAASGPLRTLLDSVEGLRRHAGQWAANDSQVAAEAIKRVEELLQQWGRFRDAQFRRESKIVARHFAMLAGCHASLEGIVTKAGQHGTVSESEVQAAIANLYRVLTQLHSVLAVLKTTLW
jgi:hypothetical protein